MYDIIFMCVSRQIQTHTQTFMSNVNPARNSPSRAYVHGIIFRGGLWVRGRVRVWIRNMYTSLMCMDVGEAERKYLPTLTHVPRENTDDEPTTVSEPTESA